MSCYKWEKHSQAFSHIYISEVEISIFQLQIKRGWGGTAKWVLSMLVCLATWGKSVIPVERMGLWAKGEAHSSGPVGWETEIVRQLLSLKLRGINWKRAGSLESVWEIPGHAVLDDPAPRWRQAYANMDALCCFENLTLRINAFQILYISSDFFCIWLVYIGKK